MSEPQAVDDSRTPPLHRRPWLIMGGIALLVVGLLAYVYFKDDPPPDDADLMPDPAPTANPANPLAVFCRDMNKHDLSDWERTLPRDMKDLDRGDDAKLEAYLSSHVAEQELFERLMRTDPKLWRWPGVDASLGSKTDLGNFSSCADYANRLSRAKVLRSAWAGKHREASEEALKVVRLGNGLVQLDGAMIHHMIAFTTQRIGEELVKSALIDASDMALLEEAQEALAPLEISSQQVARVLKVEYMFGKNSPAATPEELELMGFRGWETVVVKHLTLPNRTQAEHADRIRRLVRGLEDDWASAKIVFNEIEAEYRRARESAVRLFLAPNLGGRMLGIRAWDSTRGLIKKSCEAAALHRMRVVTLALRRYEAARGKTPETLEELVPEFLPAVPTDPFDGKPLRWKPQEKWLYSVSEDGRDNNAAHDTPMKVSFRNPDLVMPYWWLPEERR
jgi:hypothetical protein